MLTAARACGADSSYCNTGPWFGNRTVPTDTFGACILGWASGNSSKCVNPRAQRAIRGHGLVEAPRVS